MKPHEIAQILRNRGFCGQLLNNDHDACILEQGHDHGIHERAMGLVVIDARDLRCTLKEQISELLGAEFHITEVDGNFDQYTNRIADALFACADRIVAPESTDLAVIGGMLTFLHSTLEGVLADRNVLDRKTSIDPKVVEIAVGMIENFLKNLPAVMKAGPNPALVLRATNEDDQKFRGAAVIHETFGEHPAATLELRDEGDKFRIRVREPHGKASIFLTESELERLAREALYFRGLRTKP